MHCYVCALDGATTGAVGICKLCAVGLCMDHLAENARRDEPGGMTAFACLHNAGYEGRARGGANPPSRRR